MLLFFVGENAYAVDCQYIQEVIPKVELTKILHTPASIAGMINIGSQPIAVIDLCQLIASRPSSPCLHTRIILLSVESHTLGVIAEKVIEIVDKDPNDFVDTGIRIKDLPFLEGVNTNNGGAIQLFNTLKFFQSMQSMLNETVS
jgi:chemotaxis signal transduction protein